MVGIYLGVEYNMVTVKDFRKLIDLEKQGYHIYVDGEEIHGLLYDENEDWTEYKDACEEMVCSFTFVLDRYTIVQGLREHQNAEWTVERHTSVKWREFPDWCRCKEPDIDLDAFGGGVCRKCRENTF